MIFIPAFRDVHATAMVKYATLTRTTRGLDTCLNVTAKKNKLLHVMRADVPALRAPCIHRADS